MFCVYPDVVLWQQPTWPALGQELTIEPMKLDEHSLVTLLVCCALRFVHPMQA
jgi:hypothetical protein